MTRDKILNMPAGREMDALIATKVMGWKVDDLTATSPTGSSNARIPHGDEWLPYYSTDIAAAWEVIDKVQHYFVLRVSSLRAYPLVTGIFYKGDLELLATAPTTPLVICRAALLAVMEDK